MYLLNDDLTDFSVNWPVTVPSGQALTAACFADILNTDDPELMFAERGGSGGQIAAPTAKQIFQYLLNGREGITDILLGEDSER